MKTPKRFLMRMALFVLAVLAVGGFLFAPLQIAFMTNAPLNGLILGVLFLGIINNFRQVTMLHPDIAWAEQFQKNQSSIVSSDAASPRLLAPMATMLGDRQGSDQRISLSTLSMRSLLDGIYSRLDESRDLSRYTIGLLIFLGLLGTFWGLIQTVSSIGDVIGALSVAGGDMTTVFEDLKQGLEKPLDGMGTAFSSSLFGLAGSLVLGFLDLQAGQAQNRFYNDLEEWLSSLTKLSSGSMSGDGDQSVPAYVQALLEQTAESLQDLQRSLTRGEDNRIAATQAIASFTEKVGSLTDHMRTEQTVMKTLAENQAETRKILVQLANAGDSARSSGGLDDVSRSHLRNIDLHLARFVEDSHQGREDMVQQIRSEIKLLARTIAAASNPDPGR